MEKNKYIAAVSLGCGNIAAAAATLDPDGRLRLLGVVRHPMQGIVRGEVNNIEQVSAGLRLAVSDLEEMVGGKIDGVFTGISGEHLQCAKSSYYVYIGGSDNEIRDDDVRKLWDSMNNLQPPQGICILDRIPQKYVIDSQSETMEPVGRFGQRLEATFNFLLGNRAIVDRIGRTFQRIGVSPLKIFAHAAASAEAVLSDDERDLGAAVVDIGAGCTDICIWYGNIMRYVATLPIGSDAINRDIRSSAIPERHIEKLKINHGYATADAIPEDKREASLRIPGRTPRETKVISYSDLTRIVESRMLDIVEAVEKALKESGYAGKLSSGIVLTGGGSCLSGTEELFRRKLGLEVRTAVPENGLSADSLEKASDPSLSTVIGIMLMALRESPIEVTEREELDGEISEQEPETLSETVTDGQGGGEIQEPETGNGQAGGKKRKKKPGWFKEVIGRIFDPEIIDEDM